MIKKRCEEGKNDECVAVTNYPLDHPSYDLYFPRLAQLVTLGVVYKSSLQQMDPIQKCKSVIVHLSSLFVNRLQTIIHIVYERVSTPLCVQMTRDGFEFSTRDKHIDLI